MDVFECSFWDQVDYAPMETFNKMLHTHAMPGNSQLANERHFSSGGNLSLALSPEHHPIQFWFASITKTKGIHLEAAEPCEF